jgi:hypothetical protein
MEVLELSPGEYERDRRRLNARLGSYLLCSVPVPLLLLALGVPPPLVLLLTIGAAVMIGVAYPLWWRARHNPYRLDVRERRTVRVLFACRSSAIVSAVTAAVVWVAFAERDGHTASVVWVVMLSMFSAACFLFSIYAQRKALGIGGDERAPVPQERRSP